MNGSPLSHDVRIAAEIVDRIKAHGISADDPDFGNLVDGECSLNDRLRRIWRFVRWKRLQADTCDRLIAELKEARDRHLDKADEAEGDLIWGLQESGQKKLEAPDFVVSVISGGKGALKVDCSPDALPADLVTKVVQIKPNTEAIRARLEAGGDVPGCRISNPQPYLTARKR